MVLTPERGLKRSRDIGGQITFSWPDRGSGLGNLAERRYGSGKSPSSRDPQTHLVKAYGRLLYTEYFNCTSRQGVVCPDPTIARI